MSRTRTRAIAATTGALALILTGQQAGVAAYGPTTGGFVVGRQNNFGFHAAAVPCVFFENGQPRDLDVFDGEAADASDHVERWTQRFTAQLPVDFHAVTLTVQLREVFSDNTRSVVSIDGVVRPLVGPGDTPSKCGPPVVRTITLTGADAAVADDGVLRMVFRENGDDVALDWSAVTVTDASGTSYGGLG